MKAAAVLAAMRTKNTPTCLNTCYSSHQRDPSKYRLPTNPPKTMMISTTMTTILKLNHLQRIPFAEATFGSAHAPQPEAAAFGPTECASDQA